MLTADLVNARRRNGELHVTPLDAARRARALEIAEAYVGIATAHVGLDRQAFQEACREVTVPARDRRLADGLLKLVADRCLFEEDAACDPAELRRQVFERAAAARRSGSFDRVALVGTVAAERGVDLEAIDRTLFADLPLAHRLARFDGIAPERLVDGYELAQVQAVLLRAVRVRAEVRARRAETYRFLFRRLKFHQLLFSVGPTERGGYALGIDGPYSMFEAVTRYGLKLALAFPAITACDEWTLTADLLWGPARQPLTFRQKGKGVGALSEAELGEPAATLLARVNDGEPGWRARASDRVVNLPGVGVCVPDLELERVADGKRVLVELLGFWSRDAVWKRVELARAGLPEPIVFAVSKHLRVSEAVLDEDAAAALYVYANVPSAKALLERASKLVG